MSACGAPIAPVAIVGYSGLLVVPPDANPEQFAAEIKSRPPVLLIHGDQDDLIPAQALFHASSGLAALGVPVEWHISHGIGHGIDQEGLRHGGEFLARRIPPAPLTAAAFATAESERHMDAETFALIVGGGPVGLAASIELSWRAVPTS